MDHKVDLIPIINKQKILVDILTLDKVFIDQEKISKIKIPPDVVIMAGGKGTRLKPFTHVLPKPLVPINDKPFIQHIIKILQNMGVIIFLLP